MRLILAFVLSVICILFPVLCYADNFDLLVKYKETKQDIVRGLLVRKDIQQILVELLGKAEFKKFKLNCQVTEGFASKNKDGIYTGTGWIKGDEIYLSSLMLNPSTKSVYVLYGGKDYIKIVSNQNNRMELPPYIMHDLVKALSGRDLTATDLEFNYSEKGKASSVKYTAAEIQQMLGIPVLKAEDLVNVFDNRKNVIFVNTKFTTRNQAGFVRSWVRIVDNTKADNDIYHDTYRLYTLDCNNAKSSNNYSIVSVDDDGKLVTATDYYRNMVLDINKVESTNYFGEAIEDGTYDSVAYKYLCKQHEDDQSSVKEQIDVNEPVEASDQADTSN
ncbi:hypothetical protein LPW11_06100 [Geomonas sp. RF6]|uniref:hypothetical protein n=1 Tax=Geomonas sp. RF6 TaxID=2897342 RepID=UPI001E4C598F|nr:hypothetical protein [Geomonas sp. RF6]UFS71762.1 hypothetical protein LPW11_06100 [Geomonas sp. RF6]